MFNTIERMNFESLDVDKQIKILNLKKEETKHRIRYGQKRKRDVRYLEHLIIKYEKELEGIRAVNQSRECEEVNSSDVLFEDVEMILDDIEIDDADPEINGFADIAELDGDMDD